MHANLAHAAANFLNTPLALAPERAEGTIAALAQRFGLGPRADDVVLVLEHEVAVNRSQPAYDVVAGVAILPVQGFLVDKLGLMTPWAGFTGYDGIWGCLALALADGSVRAIALDIDSQGGMIAGSLDLADAIHAARGVKPIWAVLSESACGTAYLLASACDCVMVPRTGLTGGIGVLIAHVEFSKALTDAGIAVTLITSGQHKADGSEYVPLTDPALARMQADVDAVGGLFVRTVARNRGLTDKQVRRTEGASYLGGQGVEVGFADAVASPAQAFDALLHELEREPRRLRLVGARG